MGLHPVTEIDGDPIDADIVIDTREQERSPYFKRLTHCLDIEGISWVRHKLPSGDTFINRGLGLKWEMKSVGDLLNSFTGKSEKHGDRLSNELNDLKPPKLTWEQITSITNQILSRMEPDADPTDLDSDLLQDILQLAYTGCDMPTCLVIRGGLTVQIDYHINEKSAFVEKRGKMVTETSLKHTYEFRYLDDSGKHQISSVHPNSWLGIKRKIQHFVPIVETGNLEHTVAWVISQWNAQKKKEAELKKGLDPSVGVVKTVKRRASDRDKVLGILQSFAGIGSVASQSVILSPNFTSVRDFVTKVKTPEQLKECSMNEPNAKEVLRLLDIPFGKLMKKD